MTELRRRRADAQLLAGDAGFDPPAAPAPRLRAAHDAVSHLLAVQAQDLSAARLALRARYAGGVDAALTAERSLVVAWLLRGTLHLVAAEDHGWLHALTAPLLTATSRRRLAQLGVDEAAVAVVERAVGEEGPLTRPEVAERLEAAGVRADGQRTPHLLGLAAASGGLVLGPVREDGAHAFASTRDWLGAPPQPVDRGVAEAELARRYLRGHGPASAADLARWSGLGLRTARAGFTAIASELVEEEGGLVDLAGRPAQPGPTPPRLLPAFDPYLLGWKDRAFAVAPEHARAVHPGGGIIRATMLDDGRVVGTWTRDGGRVRLAPFAPLPPAAEAAFEREASALEAVRGAGAGPRGQGV